MRNTVPSVDKNDVFQYLDALNESGSVNMSAASLTVAEHFEIGDMSARMLIAEWKSARKVDRVAVAH